MTSRFFFDLKSQTYQPEQVKIKNTPIRRIFYLNLFVASASAFRTAGAFFSISAAALASALTTASFLFIVLHMFAF
jgi:hypothetical protein